MNEQNKSSVDPMSREELERLHGRVWSQEQLDSEFNTTAIIDLTVIVRAKDSSGKVGSLDYQNAPRFYFNFRAAPASN